MNGWGRGTDTGRRVTLWLAGTLLGVALCLLATGYDSAAARVREQGTYCLRIGPHPSGLAMWSDDGVHWYE